MAEVFGPMSLGNFNWAEVVWTVIATAGVIFSTINYNRRTEEVQTARRWDGNGLRVARVLLARSYQRRALLRLSVFIVWLLLGLTFGLFEVPVPVVGFTALCGLIGTALILVLSAYAEFRETDTIDEILDQEHFTGNKK